jgi:uncharacterized membrane protein
LQGVLSGILFAVGYGVGNLVLAIWRFLQLPLVTATLMPRATRVLTAIALFLAALTLARAPVWQNSIRAVMEIAPVEATGPFTIAGTAVGVALVVIFLTRLLIWMGTLVVGLVRNILPDRLAKGFGIAVFVLALISLVDGFIVKKALRAMDQTFAVIDQRVDNGVTPPTVTTSSGGPDSLIAWNTIGRTGKNFIAQGSAAEAIEALHNRPADEPVRIYVGFNSAETIERRAELALADLIRAGGFERSTLVVATTTGTGWMDPAAVEPLAYITDGDVAVVTLQYSYLPSWMTLIVDPDRSRRAPRGLFDVVYNYWTKLPIEARPKLYLFGLSLGALGSETSVDLVTLFEDPIQGALWAGPPFASTIWPQVVAGRAERSPAWRPVFRDGRLIRFMTQDGQPDASRGWGKMRLMYLQHPSDPMSFFSPSLAFNRPDWLVDRGPDISPYFNWYPLVTFVQVMFDIPLATSVPPGYGHTFKAEEYIDAWVEVLNPVGWSVGDTDRLKSHFANFNASPL